MPIKKPSETLVPPSLIRTGARPSLTASPRSWRARSPPPPSPFISARHFSARRLAAASASRASPRRSGTDRGALALAPEAAPFTSPQRAVAPSPAVALFHAFAYPAALSAASSSIAIFSFLSALYFSFPSHIFFTPLYTLRAAHFPCRAGSFTAFIAAALVAFAALLTYFLGMGIAPRAPTTPYRIAPATPDAP